MKQVKVEVIIDTRDVEQINALNNLLVVIGKSEDLSEGEKPVESGNPTPKKQKTRKDKPTEIQETETIREVETVQETEIAQEVETTHESEIKEEVNNTPSSITYTVEEVRQILKDKVSDHREEIKNKLSELEAPNVSSLKPEKYSEFVDFLNSLD